MSKKNPKDIIGSPEWKADVERLRLEALERYNKRTKRPCDSVTGWGGIQHIMK